MTVTAYAYAWLLERADGARFGFTNHTRDKSIDIADGAGATLYKAEMGGVPSAVQSSSSFSVDNLEVEHVVNDAGITEADIRAGKWDNARVTYFRFDWRDPSNTVEVLRRGRLGNITQRDGIFKAEFRGLLAAYQTEIGDLIAPGCRFDFGDSDCGVPVDPPAWQAASLVTKNRAADQKHGSQVKPSAFNDRHFRASVTGYTGGSEPAWNTTIGATTIEDLSTLPAWSASTAYGLGALVIPTGGLAGFIFEATTAGTSGASEPTWPSAAGDTVADGSVVWTARTATPAEWETIQARAIEATVTGVIDGRTFTLDYAGDASASLLLRGLCRFTSGENAGSAIDVKEWDPVTQTLTLFLPTGAALSIGDAVTVKAGCNKRRADCTFWENMERFGGFPDLPGSDFVSSFVTPPRG